MKREEGLTIIELLVAAVVFSLVLIIALAGILQITKMYNRGVYQSRVQDLTRAITDEIGESIRYTNEIIDVNPAYRPNSLNDGDNTTYINYFCLGPKRYTYAVDWKLKTNPDASKKETRHALWVDQASCATDGPADLTQEVPSIGGRELLSDNMRIIQLDVIDITSDVPDTYIVSVSVGFGDDETQFEGPMVLNSTNDGRTCKGFASGLGGEFCAVSTLSITAERRL